MTMIWVIIFFGYLVLGIASAVLAHELARSKFGKVALTSFVIALFFSVSIGLARLPVPVPTLLGLVDNWYGDIFGTVARESRLYVFWPFMVQ